MKKVFYFLLLLIILNVFSLNIYADEYNGNSEKDDTFYKYNEYLPTEIIDILNQNNGQVTEKSDINFIFELISKYIKAAVLSYSSFITELLFTIFIFAIIKRITDNDSVLLITKWLFVLIICTILYLIFEELYKEISTTLKSITEILNIILPSFITLLLMGGATTTAATATISFGATVVCLESLLSNFGLSLTVITFIFMIFERISPVFENVCFVKYLKKYTVMLITFVSTVFMTVLSFQTLLSARTDSLSTRSIKFAASNFIPLIGTAVGEAFKTVSTGVDYLKAYVGGAVSLSLFFVAFPIIAKLFVVKMLITLCAFFSSACGIDGEKAILDSFLEVVDILLSIIIYSFVLSLLVIVLFSNITLT